jgi:hypothetical protein
MLAAEQADGKRSTSRRQVRRGLHDRGHGVVRLHGELEGVIGMDGFGRIQPLYQVFNAMECPHHILRPQTPASLHECAQPSADGGGMACRLLPVPEEFREQALVALVLLGKLEQRRIDNQGIPSLRIERRPELDDAAEVRDDLPEHVPQELNCRFRLGNCLLLGTGILQSISLSFPSLLGGHDSDVNTAKRSISVPVAAAMTGAKRTTSDQKSPVVPS